MADRVKPTLWRRPYRLNLELGPLTASIQFLPGKKTHRNPEIRRHTFYIDFCWPNHTASIMIQYQMPGFTLKPHVDGPVSAKTFWLLLWAARAGGHLFLTPDSAIKRWLHGRAQYFDAGTVVHEVSPVLTGRRVVFMAQFARYR